jgi:hypothetical protein
MIHLGKILPLRQPWSNKDAGSCDDPAASSKILPVADLFFPSWDNGVEILKYAFHVKKAAWSMMFLLSVAASFGVQFSGIGFSSHSRYSMTSIHTGYLVLHQPDSLISSPFFLRCNFLNWLFLFL